MRGRVRSICLMACLPGLLLASTSHGATITTLHGTGVDDLGMPLADGALDTHWRVVVSPDPAYPGPDAFVLVDDAPLFQGGGTPNTLTSKWIGPRADGLHNFPRSDCTVGCTTADYQFETIFDLDGLNPSTAQITGQWTMDDSATMFLNGVEVANYPFQQGVNWRFFAPFSVNSGFLPGLNTLTVVVNNRYFPNSQLRDNPTGFQMQLSGTAEIPEPVSLLLLAMGGAFHLRRRQAFRAA